MSTDMEEMLGIPVIPISAAKNEGIDELIEHALHVAQISGKAGRNGLLRCKRATAVQCTAACTPSCT